MKCIAVLDADIFVYKVAQAATKEVMFDEYAISIGDSAEAKVALDNWFDHVCTKLDADKMILAFTGNNNYRKELWPEYKMHRQTPKPILMKELRQYCDKNYECKVDKRLEADDIVGQYMSKSYLYPLNEYRYIGVSEDKDLQGVPGWLFNPAKDAIPYKVELEDAIKFFYTQVITGDTSDGYKGVPGLGPVRAAKYINRAWEESEGVYEFIEKGWDALFKLYDSDLGELEQNANMAKILWYGEKPGPFNLNNLREFWRAKHGK